jgi:hypothetical protein
MGEMPSKLYSSSGAASGAVVAAGLVVKGEFSQSDLYFRMGALRGMSAEAIAAHDIAHTMPTASRCAARREVGKKIASMTE